MERKVNKRNHSKKREYESSTGLRIICFFIPLIGLIVYAVNIVQSPKIAKECGLYALIGFIIGTLKVPNIEKFEFSKKTGGENLDDVIKRAIKFKTKGKKIYIYKEEEKNAK